MSTDVSAAVQRVEKILKKGRKSDSFIYSITLSLCFLNFLAVVLLFSIFHTINPIIFFFPGIILSAWYGGLKPGLIATIISITGIAAFFFLPFSEKEFIPTTSLYIEISFFVFMGAFISYVIELINRPDKIIGYEKQIQQYERLVAKMEKNYLNAQKEIKARDEFLTIASHELKTPVTSMLLQVQTALHSIRNVSLANFSVENLMKMLMGTEQQSQRLSKMINDLLNVSLITTGRLDLEKEKMDLSLITKEVVDRFSEKLKHENIELHFSSEKPVVGKWDKLRIEQAVSNLVSNAIKYGDKKPIEIAVSNSNAKGRVTVKDQGIGIPQDQMERIFEKFERAAKSPDYKGLGVGLYITNQIVKAHNGKIHVESKEGKETTFTIELPIENI